MPYGSLLFCVLPGRGIGSLNRDFRDLLAEFNEWLENNKRDSRDYRYLLNE
jgi:hypothetical protein